MKPGGHGLGCIAGLLAFLLAGVVAYGVLALPIVSGNARATTVAIVAVCGILAIALASMAFLLFTRPARHP